MIQAVEHFTPEYLASIIELRDGVLHWKPRGENWFDPFHAGKPVALKLNRTGYLRATIKKRQIAAHRLVWVLHYGSWPTGCLDHINGCRTDNRIENLRDGPVSVNARNRARQSN